MVLRLDCVASLPRRPWRLGRTVTYEGHSQGTVTVTGQWELDIGYVHTLAVETRGEGARAVRPSLEMRSRVR